jgi:pimeloyl-ACP methyl ester carboxylesterase
MSGKEPPQRFERGSGWAGSWEEQMKPTLMFVLASLLGATAAHAQTVPDRTIDEIREARAERGAYPLIGLDPADVREALANIKTRDRDEWAAAWSEIAQRYYNAAEASHSPEERRKNFLRAWRLYYFAQWPVAAAEGKKLAYAKTLDAFLRANEAISPPLEVIRIPFEGKEIVGYLRLPSSADGPVPLVLAISGLDSRKENMADTYGALIGRGIGFFAVDGPGTGQSPIKSSPTADRVFSRILDYLNGRKEIDPKRIVVHGVSFGGYWASKLAITEHDRLGGAVVQSPPIADFFSIHHLETSLLGNREYLFDQLPALLDVVEGATGIPELESVMAMLSLKAQGLLGKPTAPMLVIAGVKDTQVPISDIYLLLNSGDVPKDAWINPSGGHLGRERSGWTDPVIFQKIIVPWEIKMFSESKAAGAGGQPTGR